MKDISLIFASTITGLIGVDNKIPWHVPEDLKKFKEITSGTTVIMGRKTYQSIGKPLPNRTNIVVTSNEEYDKIPGITAVHSIASALNHSKGKIFFIGGVAIYNEALKFCDTVYFTKITPLHSIPEGNKTVLSDEFQRTLVEHFDVIQRPDPGYIDTVESSDAIADFFVLQRKKDIIRPREIGILRKII